MIKIISKPVCRYKKRNKEVLKDEISAIKRYQAKAIRRVRKSLNIS